MLTNSQVARVLWIQEISDLLVVDLSLDSQHEGDHCPEYSYLYVRNLYDKANVRIPRMAFITLPKQLFAGERDDTLVRTILL